MDYFEPKAGINQNPLNRIVERSLEMPMKTWYVKREMEETVQGEGKESRRGKGHSSPKTSQEVLLKCRLEYELGSWKSLRELSDRHGINEKTLQGRITREKWNLKRQALISKVEAKVEAVVVKEASQAEVYLQNSFKRAVKFEAIAEASISQAATNEQGIPLVDPDTLDVITRSLARLHELAKSSLRLPNLATVDVQTGGQSLGESFVMAIAKLRAEKDAPRLGSADLATVLDADIVED